MTDSLREMFWSFWLRVLSSVVLSCVVYYGVQAFGHWIAYWAALLISAVVVFGGWLFLDSGEDWWR